MVRTSNEKNIASKKIYKIILKNLNLLLKNGSNLLKKGEHEDFNDSNDIENGESFTQHFKEKLENVSKISRFKKEGEVIENFRKRLIMEDKTTRRTYGQKLAI